MTMISFLQSSQANRERMTEDWDTTWLLRSVGWLSNDVSGQPIGFVSKSQVLSRNVDA